MNAEQASKKCDAEADPATTRGRLPLLGKTGDRCTQQFRRGSGDGMHVQGDCTQHGKPDTVEVRDLQPDSREG